MRSMEEAGVRNMDHTVYPMLQSSKLDALKE